MNEPAAEVGRTAMASDGRLERFEAGSFEALFESEHRRLFGALYLVTGNADEAEDLMQEAFLKTWERWDRVGGMDDPVGYLFRTAMNAFRSRFRRARVAARRAMTGRGSEDPFAEIDTRDTVVRALRLLTPRQRAALVLTELSGYDSEEAGRMLGVKPGTIRALTHQARDALRRTMEPDDA